MARFILRRLALILIALLLVNFLGYAYAHFFLPLRVSRIPYSGVELSSEPFWTAYGRYFLGMMRFDLGMLPDGHQSILSAIVEAGASSVGLLALALACSVFAGLSLGLRAVRSETRTISRWLVFLSTVGLAMPSFYIGGLLIVATYTVRRVSGSPFPMRGLGVGSHLIWPPILALMVRPAIQIAQMTAGLLEEELGKRYILTARSVGNPWRVIRQRHALRSILAPLILATAASFRLLIGELILIEWLFNWPGLGRLFALVLVPGQWSTSVGSVLFLNPPVVAGVLTVFAALFLFLDLVAVVLVQAVDPRMRALGEGMGSADVVSFSPGFARRNRSLLVGGLVVLVVVVLAIAGPILAPHDPLEEHLIVAVDDGWETAPFPAFAVPGFPLGSDDRGRDLLSWLLWAIRPTMVVMALVAAVRLVVGTVIGVAAGWSNGRLGRILEGLISGALSVPVLMVALGAIAVAGFDTPVLAFLFGLSLTGWAETARIVRQQTQLVRGQQYIEAARVLGLSDMRIIIGHVMRQVMPMAWMLLALEISSALMTTAGLGFLGYFIGGELWVEVDDFVARAYSGMPELGQMLATAGSSSTVRLGMSIPWSMTAVGTVIFVIVLGFNLLSEGLRRWLSPERARLRTRVSEAVQRAGSWMVEGVLRPAVRWAREHAILAALMGVGVLAIVAGSVWKQVRAARQQEDPGMELAVPGGHLWASERGDPYGTLWSDTVGLADPQVQWMFEIPARLPGGPVVSVDGTVYIASEAGDLYALDGDGSILWQAELPAGAIGSPALGEGGEVYVADEEGGLTAVTPQGDVLWRFQPESGDVATSAPIVAPDGRIYYTIRNTIQAVSAEGAALWRSQPVLVFGSTPLVLDPAGDLLFWQQDAFATQDGTPRELEMVAEVDQYIVGADGRNYFRSRATVVHWRRVDSGVETLETTRWDSRMLGAFNLPVDAGVTRDQTVWLFYINLYNATDLVWLDTDGRVLGYVDYPLGQGRVMAADRDATVYVCGGAYYRYNDTPECVALVPGREEPRWVLSLERGETVVGGALVPGRMYVAVRTLDEGFLYALGDKLPDAEHWRRDISD